MHICLCIYIEMYKNYSSYYYFVGVQRRYGLERVHGAPAEYSIVCVVFVLLGFGALGLGLRKGACLLVERRKDIWV